jgi:3'-phosphoadenosine 5'-phosphosulfate sulfotransferase (PAPS reductase)/FAD synthetase
MDKKQQTLTGIKPFKVRNKKIIKSGTIKFHAPTDETPEAIINDLETIHKRTKFYSLFSGGKDSMSTTHWLDSIGKLEAVVHIKTNIGLQMTTDFVEEVCEKQGWKLHIIEPNPKFTYASHVLQYGFPLAGFHRLIMGKLKYKTMRDFALSIDRKNHCLISGVRKFESVRRMGNYPYPIQEDSVLWFGCPMFYKSSEETYRYVHENNLTISPAYSKGLGTSGECMCGSFATGGEKQMIRRLDSKLADYIEWLEDGITRFGSKEAKRYPKWGDQSRMSDLENQQQIDSFFKDNPDLQQVNEIESMVCGAECGAGSMRGMLDY